MKTPTVAEQIVGASETIDEIIRKEISDPTKEEPFYVVDVQDIVNKHRSWLLNMPRVRPFYAVKCNSCPVVLKLLASFGIGFDCASKGEIDTILNLGVSPSNIIYANPCKTPSFVKHARNEGVDMMTFDNEHELQKIANWHPKAKLVLRIKVDDRGAICRFSAKFGADVESAGHLLQVARSLGLEVIGVSFHVGSGCENAESYTKAVADARHVFDLAADLGFEMTILDLGGGWPGTSDAKVSFEQITQTCCEALDVYFPEANEFGLKSNVSIIAEPGRYYVASAFTLATQIIAKREVVDNPMVMMEEEDEGIGEKRMMYYLNDGVYGSFNCTIFDHWVGEPRTLLDVQEEDDRKHFTTTLWGPTCDSMDMIKKDVQLPELTVGEWLIFREMGAYTIAAASTFNGFQLPKLKYHLREQTLEALRIMPTWRRLAKAVQVELETGDLPEDEEDEEAFVNNCQRQEICVTNS